MKTANMTPAMMVSEPSVKKDVSPLLVLLMSVSVLIGGLYGLVNTFETMFFPNLFFVFMFPIVASSIQHAFFVQDEERV